jgi:hypothetical protein
MQTHISIAFYGKFRPLHIEAETTREALKYACQRITCDSIKSTLEKLHADYTRQRKAGIGIVSACSEYGGVSVRIAEGSRDTWLDSLTNGMPENPLLTY